MLRRSLVGWLSDADSAGLDADGMTALFASVVRDFAQSRDSGAARPTSRCASHEHRRGAAARQAATPLTGLCASARWRFPQDTWRRLLARTAPARRRCLNSVVGLAAPSEGHISVLGGQPAGSAAALDGIAFVAQDTPLYRNLTAADMLHMTRNLNRRFDDQYAKARLHELEIPLKRAAGQLSGGQQAQVALTLALARRPKLLVLDEPMAMLDPLARHDFMAAVMTAIADDGVSVVLSSHVLAELERGGRLPRSPLTRKGSGRRSGGRSARPTLRPDRPGERGRRLRAEAERRARPPRRGASPPTGPDERKRGRARDWEKHRVSLEELTLAYLREPTGAALPGPARLETPTQ